MRSWLKKPLGAVLVAGAILATGGAIILPATTGGGPLAGDVANLWMDSNGGTCTRSASPVVYSDGAACGTGNAAYTAASGGDVVLVRSGTYTGFAPGTKTGRVTFREQPGQTVTWSNSTWGSGNKNVTLDGFNLNGWDLGSNSTNGYVTNVTVQNSSITGQVEIFTNNSPSGGMNVLFDSNKFNPVVTSGGAEGVISPRWPGGSGTQNDTGITISNNEFDGGGTGSNKCSDGVQTGAAAVHIIGNVFHGYLQSECNGPHSDSLQMFGSSRTVIRDNVFYNDTVGIAAYDGEPSPVIENNAFRGVERDDENIACGGCSSPVIQHNTLVGAYVNVTSKTGQQTTNATIKNNVATAGVRTDSTNPRGADATYTVNDYNLCSSNCTGANSITGTPVFTAGATFTTLAGAALTAASPGYHAGSDGTSMGVVP